MNSEKQIIAKPKNIRPNTNGYWEIGLFKSSELDPVTDYKFQFSGYKFKLSEEKTIPDLTNVNYLEL